MNVSLTPELEAFVQEMVKGGQYVSASEVVRDALRLLEHQGQVRQAELDRLRAAVQVGLDQMERGEGLDGDEVFAEIHRHIDALITERERRRA